MEDKLPPFLLQIITPDREHYYEVPSSELKDPKPLTPLMKELVGMQVNMAHQPWPNPGLLGVFGTFIVNLSAFVKASSHDKK